MSQRDELCRLRTRLGWLSSTRSVASEIIPQRVTDSRTRCRFNTDPSADTHFQHVIQLSKVTDCRVYPIYVHMMWWPDQIAVVIDE